MRFCILLLLLAACQPRPPIEEPVIVKIPVAVSCHAPAVPAPHWNVPRLAGDSEPTDKLKAVLADLNVSKGYIEELKAELTACG